MTTLAKPHGFVTKGIHWLSAGLIGYGCLKGLNDISQLADPAVFQFEITFAALIGAMFVFRLFWTRKIGGTTRLPEDGNVLLLVRFVSGSMFRFLGSFCLVLVSRWAMRCRPWAGCF